MIGIWKQQNNTKPPLTTFFSNKYCDVDNNKGYGLEITSAKLTDANGYVIGDSYGVQCVNGTMIEMILDMDELALSFAIDNKDYGKALNVEEAKYRAAVCMLQPNDSITLLE